MAVYVLPKWEYTAVHPYTSRIPITLWVILRNLTGFMWHDSLALYMAGWAASPLIPTPAKLTPGCLLVYLMASPSCCWLSPAKYPLLNFAGTTAGEACCTELHYRSFCAAHAWQLPC